MKLILRIAQKRNKHIDEATSNIRIKDTSKISSSEINTKKTLLTKISQNTEKIKDNTIPISKDNIKNYLCTLILIPLYYIFHFLFKYIIIYLYLFLYFILDIVRNSFNYL